MSTVAKIRTLIPPAALMLAVLLGAGGRDAPGVASGGAAATVFDVDGIRVLHAPVQHNDVVAVNLYLLGGARQVTETTAGIEPLLLHASERGTERFPGTSVLEAQVRTGSRVFVAPGPDWTTFGFGGLAEEFEATWEVFADRILHPTLETDAVEVARNRMLTAARARGDDPDALVARLAASLAFAGHAYGVPTAGTESSLAALTVEDLRRYHAEQMVKSRMLLVVVGDVSRERIENAVRGTLATLPAGAYEWTMPERWTASDARVAVRQHAIATNYILGYFGGPRASDRRHPAFEVAVEVLSYFIHSAIREEGFSYAANAYVLDRAASGGAIYVTTTRPEETIEIVNQAIDLLQEGVFRRSDLRARGENQVMNYYLANETNGEQASFLGRTYLYRGVTQSSEEFVEFLRGIDPADVRRVARDYFGNIQYAFVGDTLRVPRAEMEKH